MIEARGRRGCSRRRGAWMIAFGGILALAACAPPPDPPVGPDQEGAAASGPPPLLCRSGVGSDAEALALLGEINRLRRNPSEYAPLVKAGFKDMQDGIFLKDGYLIETKEGQAAVDEAIAFLNTAPSAPPLELSTCLSRSAQDHANDQGQTGDTGHIGEDGSNPGSRAARHVTGTPYCGENISYGSRSARDIVIQLLVDDGVPDRGHRKGLFRKDFKSIGIGYGPHPRYRHMSVQLMCLNDVRRG